MRPTLLLSVIFLLGHGAPAQSGETPADPVEGQGGDAELPVEMDSDGLVVDGCAGDHYVAGDGITLYGTAPEGTVAVLVAGEPVDFDLPTRDWSYADSLSPGITEFTVEAVRADATVVATATLRAIRVRVLDGEIDADVTLEASAGPFLVAGHVTVPSGRRLTIEAGCELLLQPDISFFIRGEIHAAGTAGSPIRFSRVPCRENWGFLRFDDSDGENTFRFCEWSYGGGDPGCLTLYDSRLELESCTLRDIDGEGVHAVRCRTRIRYCLAERTGEAFSLDDGDTVVEYCTVRDAVGKSDLVDVNGNDGPPARIAYNLIYNTPDDGIDVDGGELVIEGNVIHGCGDQAMSLVGTGHSTVRFNLCYGNTHGLSVKDSHECIAEFNTFALHSETGVRAIEKTAGRGGGIITLRDSIVWANAEQLVVESTGSMAVSYCDVQGITVPGPANFSMDPLFVEPQGGDFRLQAQSPCIGAASDGGDLGAFPFEPLPEAPVILGITPEEGPTTGGTAIVIVGQNFTAGVTVYLGDEPVDAVEVPHSQEIRGATPIGTRGPVNLVVTTAGGEAVLEQAFTYFEEFLRGDVSHDSRRNVSDVIQILEFLFTAGPAPPCPAVADANNDNAVDVSDPIFLLLFLFTGGTPPAPDAVLCR